MRTFHYALRPGGYLFLGPSEGVTRNTNLFAALDKKHRILQRRDAEQRPCRALRCRPAHPAARRAGSAGAAAGPREDRIDRSRAPRHGETFARLRGHRPATRDPALLRRRGRPLSRALARHGQPEPVQHSAQIAADRRCGPPCSGARDGSSRSSHEELAVKIDGKSRPVRLIVEPMPEAEPKPAIASSPSRTPRPLDGTRRSGRRRRRTLTRHPGAGAGAAHRQDAAPGRDRRTRDVQRGDEVRQRGVSVGQRGAAVLERGARNLEGGDAVGQRGAADDQRRDDQPRTSF